jgi:hypothetical protein
MFHYNPRMLQQQQVQFQSQSQQRQVPQQHANRQRARQTQQGNKLSDITSQSFDLYGVQDPTFMVADNTAVQHADQVYSQQQQLQSLSERSAQREQPQFSQAQQHHTLQTLQSEASRPGAQTGFENSNHMMEYVDTDRTVDKALNGNNQARWGNQQFVGLHADLQKPLQQNLGIETDEDALSVDNSTPNNGSPTPKVKRPMNAFLIFSVKRRRELSSQNPTLATSEISTILGDEWAKMDADLKNNFILQAQMLKNNFDREHPDYVYTRRPNYTRKKRSNRAVQDGSPSNSGSIGSPSMYYPYGPYAFPPIPFGYQTVPIKQPPNAYLLFNRTTRPKIKNEHPDMSVSEVSKRVGEAWKFLPEEEKNKFYEEAKRLRKDFDNIQKLAKAQRENFRGKKVSPTSVGLPLGQSALSQPSPQSAHEVQEGAAVAAAAAAANFGYLGYPQSVGMPPFPMTPLPKRRLRAPKDPTQPKHPSSGFLFFLREVRPQYTAKYPKNSLGLISKMISAAWKELSAEDKAKYAQKSEEDKKRYAIEMEMWLEAKKQKAAASS